MSENEFTVTFVAEEPSGFEYRCYRCVAEDCEDLCKKLPCKKENRTDGRNVIFKLKEEK